jgi:hypothetical protein
MGGGVFCLLWVWVWGGHTRWVCTRCHPFTGPCDGRARPNLDPAPDLVGSFTSYNGSQREPATGHHEHAAVEESRDLIAARVPPDAPPRRRRWGSHAGPCRGRAHPVPTPAPGGVRARRLPRCRVLPARCRARALTTGLLPHCPLPGPRRNRA